MDKVIRSVVVGGLLLAGGVWAQAPGSSRVDLDDVSIQGELLSDDRIRLLSRAKNSLVDEIKEKTSFREDILEHLPPYFVRTPAMGTEGQGK